MAYVVVLNPPIVGTAKDINGAYVGGGDDPAVAVALVAGATTILMGVWPVVRPGAPLVTFGVRGTLRGWPNLVFAAGPGGRGVLLT